MKADIAKIKGHLATAIFETFEKMFFIFLELSEQPAGPQACAAARINFQGLLTGSLTILFSREALAAMVRNLLGLREEEITGRHLEDCAKEGINIAGGSFLASLESEKAIELSIPAFYPEVKNLETAGGDNSVILYFESDNGGIEARMAVRDEN